MSPYEIVFKINESIIKDKIISDDEKREISDILLKSVADKSTIEHFYSNMKIPKGNIKLTEIYPLFYIPPYNEGKKYRTITMVTPHTLMFTANAYELEILRILAIFDGQSEKVKDMLQRTKERISRMNFDSSCNIGEYFEISIVALRFIGTAFPEEIELIQNLIQVIKSHFGDKKRHSGTAFYYRLTLSELPNSIAVREISNIRGMLLQQLGKSYVMNSENDKYINVLDKYILRNCLTRLEEFKYIKEREPFVSEKDGRLHFDVKM
ncbi:hypothetical protein JHL18_16575 [Clostridium sp. YIM B02505]|uniref:Uncharacterized protein n=1 Tax=Clostridium yunnanense TaxID=2800325 RepID=A0ABS1ESD9_9CLOT|nr:hypothetical protein [Clostridium yunnanense]MBK1812240.1 hypothetical protein [Clostridium yunnanense]